MAVTKVFSLQNNFKQNGAIGICTAASLDWARATLRNPRGVKKASQLTNTHALNASMATVRKLDSDATDQASRFNLRVIGGEQKISSLDEVIQIGKRNSGRVVIFWNYHHTMGYRYRSKGKEFFDMEQGLFLGKTSAELKAKMQQIFDDSGYADVSGCYVVEPEY